MPLEPTATFDLENVDLRGVPVAQKARWPQAIISAQRIVDAINERARPHLADISKRLNAIVRRDGTRREKLRELRGLIDEAMAFNGDNTACRKGCSHCGHIPVSISQSEADYIGDAIGVTAKTMKGWSKGMEYGYHVPCPFLKEGQRSIYAHRPMAYRAHFNMDRDDLLCQLIPERTFPLPLMNVSQYQLAYLKIVAGENGHPRLLSETNGPR